MRSSWVHLVCSAWRSLSVDLIAICNFLMRGSGEEGADLLLVSSDRMWGNSLKVCQGKSRLDTKRKFFTERNTSVSTSQSSDLLMVHSASASGSLINISNRTDPRIQPWGPPQVTGCQPNVAPFTTTVWALPFSQFFTQHTVNLLISQLNSLFRRMLCIRGLTEI